MGILKIILGAAEIAVGIAVIVLSGGSLAVLGAMLIASGAGMVFSGVGTLLQPGVFDGFATTLRNPTAPRKVVYGRVRTGGTVVYINIWGPKDKFLDMVIVLATHPCQLGLPGEGYNQIYPQLYFDQQRITLNTQSGSSGTGGPGNGIFAPPYGAVPGSGISYSPLQTTANIQSISRTSNNANGTGGGLVTVVLKQAIPYLQAGDQIQIQNVGSGTNASLNGTFQVAEVITEQSPGYTTSFTYLSGGMPVSINNQGQAKTKWADYSNLVYCEFLDGTQTLGETFLGAKDVIEDSNGNFISNPWTPSCSLLGCTAVFIRLQYDQKYFPQGLPQLSFHIRGKNDIYDPRVGSTSVPSAFGYSENPALCIADYLTESEETFGFGYEYGTDIDLAMLTTQANLCDQQVPLALPVGGTEPAYALNGQFDLTMNRGEVLKNMLTSCAGRISEVGGKIYLNVANWDNAYQIPTFDLMTMASGPFTWKPTCIQRDLINGVRGTYVSPENNWQTADFPPYAQDNLHGYDPQNLLSAFEGDINLAADGGQRRWGNIQLPFTISYATAQRLAKIELLRKRNYGTGTFPLNMSGYQFLPFDIINVTVYFFGWVNKTLEVASTRFKLDKQNKGGTTEVTLLGTEIDLQETDSAIYQWSTQEELTPQGIVSATWAGKNYTETAPFPWSAGYVSPLPGDAIGGAATFGLQVVYDIEANGNPSTSIQIKGTPPFTPDLDLQAPQLICSPGTTTGTIPAGSYVLALASYTSGNYQTQQLTEFLDIIPVTLTATGSINIQALWGAGDDGGALYMATANDSSDDAYQFHFQQNLSPGNDLGLSTTVLTSYNQSTPGGVDPMFDRFGIQWQEVIHSGPWADTISAVTSNTITVGGNGMRANQWAGYTLSLLSRAQYLPGMTVSSLNPELILLNMPILSSTATNSSTHTFSMTIGPNASGVHLPDLTTLVNVNDLVVMRYNAIFTDNSFSDPNIANGYYPNGATNVETGHLAVVLSGADYGDAVPIASVGQDSSGHYTIVNLSRNWAITPQTGDIVVICSPTTPPGWSGASISINNGSSGPITIAEPNIENLAYQTWLVSVFTENTGGMQADNKFSPMRDVYIAGSQGTRTVTQSTVMVKTDGIIFADATAGDITFTLLPFTEIPNQTLRIQKIDGTTNTVTIATSDSSDVITDDGIVTTNLVLSSQWDFRFVTVGGN